MLCFTVVLSLKFAAGYAYTLYISPLDSEHLSRSSVNCAFGNDSLLLLILLLLLHTMVKLSGVGLAQLHA